MHRQLYYLLPDVSHTKTLCRELEQAHVQSSSLHVVVSRDQAIDGISDVHSINEIDRDDLFETFLWKLNLAIFFLALLSFLVMAASTLSYYLLIPVAIMLLTLVGGLYFSMRVPNVHWNEFTSAIQHGEVLLIVDVPKMAIQYIEMIIRRRHPEAIVGGVCWKM